ncbi:MAG: 2-phospho-L-lactate transferase [Steroidobacteraceae bacterium]
MSSPRAVALSGGVGGAKLVLGLDRVLAPGELLVVANTGDDFEHLGLHISPDIDTLLYTLSERANTDTGWGRAGETWSFMSALAELGQPVWFRLGDKDLAAHVLRTHHLRQGNSLSQVTRELARHYGIGTAVLPMSDDVVRTRVRTDAGWLDFQNYFVEKQCAPAVRELCYDGAVVANPAPGVTSALHARGLDVICICPSNPYLSIDPILAVAGIRTALGQAAAPIVAVSPIVGGQALKGPTARIMGDLGHRSSVVSIALHYRDVIDGLLIDECDRVYAGSIEKLGVEVHVARTIMRSLEDRCELARQVLKFAARLRGPRQEERSHVGAGAG